MQWEPLLTFSVIKPWIYIAWSFINSSYQKYCLEEYFFLGKTLLSSQPYCRPQEGKRCCLGTWGRCVPLLWIVYPPRIPTSFNVGLNLTASSPKGCNGHQKVEAQTFQGCHCLQLPERKSVGESSKCEKKTWRVLVSENKELFSST